jgi:hypothetical protein
MWDLIKRLGGQALQAGVGYLKHASLVEQLLQSPDPASGYALLRARVHEMDDAEFHLFRGTVNGMIGATRIQLQQARTSANDLGAWGNSFEDRLAYFQAQASTGGSAQSGATAGLEQRLYWLEAIAQSADQIRMQMKVDPGPRWLDGGGASDRPPDPVHQARAAVAEQNPVSGPLSRPAEDGIDLQGRRAAAFKRHVDRVFPQRAEAETMAARREALEPLEALQRYLQLDQRMFALMPRTLVGQADERVIEEARALGMAYAELLDVEPYGGIYSHPQIRVKMAQCVEHAGRAGESLRDDHRAVAFYREAVALFRDAGATDDVRRLESRIDELARHLSGDLDIEIATIRGRLGEQGLSALERTDALISLGEVYLRGDDTFSAAEPLREAEGLLDAECGGDPGPEALAQALISSMQGIRDGSQRAGGSEIERIMQLRGTYTRLYAALSEALEGSDPDEAERYHRLAEDRDSQARSQQFGGAATGLMFGEYAELFGLSKRS